MNKTPLLPLVLLVLLGAAGLHAAPADSLVPPDAIPPDAGILHPGVNLFEFIDWHSVITKTPCETGRFIFGPENRITYDERPINEVTFSPLAGCAEIRVPYQAPYPSDHIHVRFVHEILNRSPFDNSSTDMETSIAIEGPRGQTPEASLLPEDLLFPEISADWYQDPGPHLPHFFEEGEDQSGEIVWRFRKNAPATPLPGIDSVSYRTLEASLFSTLPQIEGPMRDDVDRGLRFAPSHIEYSFVEIPGMTVERHHVERDDGRIHDETRFSVDIPEELLAEYGVSIQLNAYRDMDFSYLVLPDGSRHHRTWGIQGPDWRELRFEVVHIQALGHPDPDINETLWQFTVPQTLIDLEGPGTYTIVLTRPGAAVPVADETLRLSLIAFSVLPLLVGAYATRNVILYRRSHDFGLLPGSHAMTLSLLALAICYVAYLLFTTLGIGWTHISRGGNENLALVTMFVLILFLTLFTILAWRSRDAMIHMLKEDVLHRERLATNLERSNRDLTLFASAAAHDLAAPLRSVRGFTQILHDEHGHRLDDEGRFLLQQTVDGANRMQRLISDLLEISKAQAKKGDMRPVPLETVCREALGNVKAKAPPNVDFQWDDPLHIHGSYASLVRLFQNLFENSVKFQPTGQIPQITVRAKNEGDHALIEVQDNGIGIHPEHLDEILRPFHRAPHDHPYEGTGLGLALVQRIIDAHDGHIRAESTPGEGTTFHIRLPKADPPPAPGHDSEASRFEGT